MSEPLEELEKTAEMLEIHPEPFMGLETAFDTPTPEKTEISGFEFRGKEKIETVFNPEVHKVNADGSPMLGSKKQFLLKTEAKNGAIAKMRELGGKVKNAFSFEKNENSEKVNSGFAEIPDGFEIPLSDHELEEKEAEEAKKEAENFAREAQTAEEKAQRHFDLTTSSENSAEMFFFGGSMFLGIEFLNQRDRYFDAVAKHIYEYERKTGKGLDLPPGAALALGLGRIGWEIAKQEPECRKRLNTGVNALRANAMGFLKARAPRFSFGKKEKSEVVNG